MPTPPKDYGHEDEPPDADALRQRVAAKAHVFVWHVDVASEVDVKQLPVGCSPELRRIFGLTGAADVQPSVGAMLQRVPPADLERLRDALIASLEDGQAHMIEHRISRPDGTTAIAVTKGCVERDEYGRTVRVVGTVQDVTNQRRMERALRAGGAAGELLARIVDQSRSAIIATTLDGTITLWNPAAQALLGYEAEEAIGRNGRMLIPSDRQQEAAPRLTALAEGRPLEPFETVRLRRDGTRVDVEVDPSPVVDDQGTPIGATFTVRDLARKRQRDALVEKAQRLEGIGRLAGGMAHDFNNLLMAITAYAELAMADLPADAPARADIARILTAATRATSLTRHLLAFGQRVPAKPVTVDLNESLSGMAGMLHALLTDRITERLALSPTPAFVHADQTQIEEMVMAFASNARDAMPNGGNCTISTAVVEFAEAEAAPSPGLKPGRYVLLTVADTGIGMDAGTQARVFEPFFTTKPTPANGGMSLATAYGNVRQTGGAISVASAPNAGTTISVFLPFQPAPTTGPKPPAREPVPQSAPGARILVVEDDALVRNATRAMLERLQHRVTVAASAQDALRLLREEYLAVDLLLTDIVMPGLSGLQLAEVVRREFPDIRVLFMSAYPGDGERGAHDTPAYYLMKPFSSEDLAAAVAGTLAR